MHDLTYDITFDDAISFDFQRRDHSQSGPVYVIAMSDLVTALSDYYFLVLWDHQGHFWSFKNRVPLQPVLGSVAGVSLLVMSRINKTEFATFISLM